MTDCSYKLPLSWQLCSSASQTRRPLFFSQADWIESATLKNETDLVTLLQQKLQAKKAIAIRGINASVAKDFTTNHGTVFQTGIEAVIQLSNTGWHRSSLRELSRRAFRFGHIVGHPAMPYPDVAKLRSESVYAKLPALNGLYLSNESGWLRGWSFVVDDKPVGLVTISQRGQHEFHTEMLLRSVHAPQGTMEALILHAAGQLKLEGGEELSLGECPFMIGDPPNLKIHKFGRLIQRAYSIEGLYRFKAKFDPIWRPVFLGSQRPLLLTLIDLFFETGCAKLWLVSIFKRRQKVTN